MRRIVTLVLVTAAATVAAGLALAAQSPQSELAAMRSAVSKKHSVHYVSVYSFPGRKVRMACDVGKREGIQRIKVTASGQTGPAEVIVRGSTAYIQGDAFTLQGYFGFTQAQATKYAGQWISIPRTSYAYATVSADATYESFLTLLYPQSQLELYHTGKFSGVRGTAVFAGTEERVRLLAPTHGKPLPAKQYETSPTQPGTSFTTFSHWGESVHVTAPANSVPISTVTAS